MCLACPITRHPPYITLSRSPDDHDDHDHEEGGDGPRAPSYKAEGKGGGGGGEKEGAERQERLSERWEEEEEEQHHHADEEEEEEEQLEHASMRLASRLEAAKHELQGLQGALNKKNHGPGEEGGRRRAAHAKATGNEEEEEGAETLTDVHHAPGHQTPLAESTASFSSSTGSWKQQSKSFRASSSDPFGFASQTKYRRSSTGRTATEEDEGGGGGHSLLSRLTEELSATTLAASRASPPPPPHPRAASPSPFYYLSSSSLGRDRKAAGGGDHAASAFAASSASSRRGGGRSDEEGQQDITRLLGRSTVSSDSSAAVLTQRVRQQQLELSRLQDENESLRRQCETHVRFNAQRKEEMTRLRREEVEGKQREAVLAAQNTRLEHQVVEMRNDVDRVLTEQAEVLIHIEATKEENEALAHALRDTRARAEEAEAKLLQTLEERRDIIKEEKRKERAAQLQRLRAFEAQLEMALGKFQAAREEVERLQAAGEEQRLELDGARRALSQARQDGERKRVTILSLQAHQRDLADKYGLVLMQQTEELTRLRRTAQEASALREEVLAFQEQLAECEHELNQRASLEGQCSSLLQIVEEQQGMILAYKERQGHQREESQRTAVKEADWRGRAKLWQKERAALEKEVRELKFQLKKALS